MPLCTDARHYAKAGVPIVLYGAGPRTIKEANAHRADERLPLSDLYRAQKSSPSRWPSCWAGDQRPVADWVIVYIFRCIRIH